MFSCEYCEIFKNNFFTEPPLMAAYVHWTMTILNFNRTLENLRTMDAFNSDSFLITDWRDSLWKAPVIAVFEK